MLLKNFLYRQRQLLNDHIRQCQTIIDLFFVGISLLLTLNWCLCLLIFISQAQQVLPESHHSFTLHLNIINKIIGNISFASATFYDFCLFLTFFKFLQSSPHLLYLKYSKFDAKYQNYAGRFFPGKKSAINRGVTEQKYKQFPMYNSSQHLFSNPTGKSFPHYSVYNQPDPTPKKKRTDHIQISGKFSSKSEYSEKIRNLMQHVHKILTRVIENLQYLYQTNGINYNVAHYFDTMMRLLTPHELLSHFHIIDNSHLFTTYSYENPSSFWCQYKLKADVSEEKIRILRMNSSREKGQNKFNKYQQSALIKPNVTQPSRQQQRNPYDYSLEKNIQVFSEDTPYVTIKQNQIQDRKLPNFRATTVLGADIEQQLASWAVKQLMAHKLIRLQDISKKAKQFTKTSEKFKCSLGWVTRFLNRHPYVHKMMRFLRKKDFKGLKDQYHKFMAEPIGRSLKNCYEQNAQLYTRESPALNPSKEQKIDDYQQNMNEFPQNQNQDAASMISELLEEQQRSQNDFGQSGQREYEEMKVKVLDEEQEQIQYEQIPYQPSKQQNPKQKTSPKSSDSPSKPQAQPQNSLIYEQDQDSPNSKFDKQHQPSVISARQLSNETSQPDKNQNADGQILIGKFI